MSAPLHTLDRLVRRIPDGFLLRGSLLTRQWARGFPRVAQDLDLLGTGPYAVDATIDRLAEAFSRDLGDGLQVPRDGVRGHAIWEGSDFPGVRVTVPTGPRDTVSVDVGFHDPVVPPAITLPYAPERGAPFPVQAVHRVTMVAWKLHGLVEWGETRWRCKDLLDLWLLCDAPFDVPDPTVGDAVRVAFESRGNPVQDAFFALQPRRWRTPAARLRWSTWVEDASLALPLEPTELVHTIEARLAPALRDLALPAEPA
ncbi:MAG: nucleotidyl transferase AbiEii/AbiGii toxin family protein [Myxococcota bacterium]